MLDELTGILASVVAGILVVLVVRLFRLNK
jgi:hypothetical protein